MVALFVSEDRGFHSLGRRVYRPGVQYGRDLPVDFPGVAEVRRGVALEGEHEYFAFPDWLFPKSLYDPLAEEKRGLRAVGLANGVLEALYGQLVH